METIGSRILSLRKKKGLSQAELGKRIQVSGVTVLKWEKDVNIPKHDSLVLLADKLESTIDYILYGVCGSSKNRFDKFVDVISSLRRQGILDDDKLDLLERMVGSWQVTVVKKTA